MTRDASQAHPGAALPSYATPLIGRRDVPRDLSAALSDARLLTLLVPPRVGETRLAIELARGLAPRPVFFCDLTAARSLDDLVGDVYRALSLSDTGALDPIAQVGKVLQLSGPCLLLLDNFERLV